MAKKKQRKKYVSKGERVSVNPKYTKAMRRDRSLLDEFINKLDAYYKGHNPWIKIPNPNKAETNKPWIKVRARSLYGDPRKKVYAMKGDQVKE